MSEGYETNEVPGVGEIRARKGTSTSELAGAAHYWSSKYAAAHKDGWRAGFFTACVFLGTLALAASAAIHYL